MPHLADCDPITGEVIRSSKTTAVRYERERPGELVPDPDRAGEEALAAAHGLELTDPLTLARLFDPHRGRGVEADLRTPGPEPARSLGCLGDGLVDLGSSQDACETHIEMIMEA